jgi:O-acetyl-ADP-ribose deacetylase (regulator of RNase III)
MNERYTVTLRYPDFNSDDWPEDLYTAHVTTDNGIDGAIVAARQMAQEDNKKWCEDPSDFSAVVVIPGWVVVYHAANR